MNWPKHKRQIINISGSFFFERAKFLIQFEACSCFTVLLLLFQNELWPHTLKLSGIWCKQDLNYIKLFKRISILFSLWKPQLSVYVLICVVCLISLNSEPTCCDICWRFPVNQKEFKRVSKQCSKMSNPTMDHWNKQAITANKTKHLKGKSEQL